MHDPMTMVGRIKNPFRRDKPSKLFPKGYRRSLVTIWHRDPQSDGSDDSCGWFKRARHGDPKALEAIIKDFDFEWDKSYGGWFHPDGLPALSVMAITLEMISCAAWHHFRKNHRKRARFMDRNLRRILHFAENTTDSLHPTISGKHGINPDREYRIEDLAGTCYGWVLRADQKWWQHARWHFWHWEFQVHPWQNFKCWLQAKVKA